MPVADSPIILTCVVIYLIVCLGIGIWAMRRTKTISDFLLAGQSLGPFVLAMAAMSSIMSGFGFIGGPGLTFESGMSSAWMTFAAMLGAPLVWIMLGKRLRLVAEARPVLTLPDVVAARYGGRLPRFFMALAILLGVLGYLGTQVMAIGLVSVAVLGVDLPLAMLIGLGVLAFYSVAGGILASVYTDLFQGLLMMGAALVVFFVAIDKAGGLSAISTTLHQMDPEFIGPWGTRGALAGAELVPTVRAGAIRPTARDHQADDDQEHPRPQVGRADDGGWLTRCSACSGSESACRCARWSRRAGRVPWGLPTTPPRFS